MESNIDLYGPWVLIALVVVAVLIAFAIVMSS